jgi:hypothetical protein
MDVRFQAEDTQQMANLSRIVQQCLQAPNALYYVGLKLINFLKHDPYSDLDKGTAVKETRNERRSWIFISLL